MAPAGTAPSRACSAIIRSAMVSGRIATFLLRRQEATDLSKQLIESTISRS
jgi:hypothetical protein